MYHTIEIENETCTQKKSWRFYIILEEGYKKKLILDGYGEYSRKNKRCSYIKGAFYDRTGRKGEYLAVELNTLVTPQDVINRVKAEVASIIIRMPLDYKV